MLASGLGRSRANRHIAFRARSAELKRHRPSPLEPRVRGDGLTRGCEFPRRPWNARPGGRAGATVSAGASAGSRSSPTPPAPRWGTRRRSPRPRPPGCHERKRGNRKDRQGHPGAGRPNPWAKVHSRRRRVRDRRQPSRRPSTAVRALRDAGPGRPPGRNLTSGLPRRPRPCRRRRGSPRSDRGSRGRWASCRGRADQARASPPRCHRRPDGRPRHPPPGRCARA